MFGTGVRLGFEPVNSSNVNVDVNYRKGDGAAAAAAVFSGEAIDIHSRVKITCRTVPVIENGRGGPEQEEGFCVFFYLNPESFIISLTSRQR